MRIIFRFIFILLLFFTFSCSGKNKQEDLSIIKESSQDLQMIDAYKEGLDALDIGDGLGAAKKFNEAELLFPQSIWASRAALMSAYSYYSQMYYDDAIYEIEIFLKKYKDNEREDYAYYLLALSHYEKISDEKRDLGPIIEAKKNFEIIIDKFPNTDFAIDSNYKLELINEILASKEMFIANHYLKKEKWIPAINRFKFVVDNYDRSIYVEEALHRLVELHYKIGLVEESKKYGSILGYNYQSSEWYEETYKVFNKNYKKRSIKKSKRKSLIIEKIKSLIN
tara:strand:+ start:143 stop:985 length:843 start_codon:yes stop_codon:yes gene_type:complete